MLRVVNGWKILPPIFLFLFPKGSSGGGGSFDMDAYATKMWELDEYRIDPSCYTVDLQGYKSSSSSPYDDFANDP